MIAVSLYHVYWVAPVCILCYICSVFWYQDIADLAYRHHRRIKNDISLTKSLSNTVYSTLVWFMAYSQTVILSKIVPIVLRYYLEYIIEPLFHRTVAFSFFARGFVELLSASSQILGLLMTACMYGWYAFDPTWISSGMGTDDRLARVERHWAYFLGFGLPYLLLFKATSFFIGYGVYLSIFPVGIILGSTLDFKGSYAPKSDPVSISATPVTKARVVERKPVVSSETTVGKSGSETPPPGDEGTRSCVTIPPLAIFGTARGWSTAALHAFHSYSGIQNLIKKVKPRATVRSAKGSATQRVKAD